MKVLRAVWLLAMAAVLYVGEPVQAANPCLMSCDYNYTNECMYQVGAESQACHNQAQADKSICDSLAYSAHADCALNTPWDACNWRLESDLNTCAMWYQNAADTCDFWYWNAEQECNWQKDFCYNNCGLCGHITCGE